MATLFTIATLHHSDFVTRVKPIKLTVNMEHYSIIYTMFILYMEHYSYISCDSDTFIYKLSNLWETQAYEYI
jgi:hypothetical protein